jgi:hypothetical protein
MRFDGTAQFARPFREYYAERANDLAAAVRSGGCNRNEHKQPEQWVAPDLLKKQFHDKPLVFKKFPNAMGLTSHRLINGTAAIRKPFDAL